MMVVVDAWSPTPQSATTVRVGREWFDRSALETSWLVLQDDGADDMAPHRALLDPGLSVGEAVRVVGAARQWTGRVVQALGATR